jgi:glycosyltransferase involved in cell wall biosynthesis
LLKSGSFKVYPSISHDSCLNIVSKSNVAVSLSDNESFGIYIAEAMSNGAVVLRTAVGGHHETVVDGKNGFLLKMDGFDFSERLVQLADRALTPDNLLRDYLVFSKTLISPYVGAGYQKFISRLSRDATTIKSARESSE